MSVRDSIIWVRLSSVGHWSSPSTTSACRKIAFRGLRISWTIFPAISPSKALRWTCHVICSRRCCNRFSLSVKALSSVWRTGAGSASSVRHWRRRPVQEIVFGPVQRSSWYYLLLHVPWWRSYTRAESMQKTSVEISVNLVHREHMLSHLGMQFFIYTSGVINPAYKHEVGYSLVPIAHLSF